MRGVDRQIKAIRQEWRALPSYRAAFAFLHLSSEGVVVLDFGCGNGDHCPVWQRHGNRVIGIDASTKALDTARRNHPDVEFYLAGSEIPLPDHSVDVVISLDSIEHVENDKESLTEMWRVLKPRGQLILTTPYRNILGDWMDGDNFLFLPLIRLKNLLLRRRVSIPRHRHYKSADILGLSHGKFELEEEQITGGLDTVLLAALGKFIGIVSGKLKLQDNTAVSWVQKQIKTCGQNTHFRRWGPLADKLNIVLRSCN